VKPSELDFNPRKFTLEDIDGFLGIFIDLAALLREETKLSLELSPLLVLDMHNLLLKELSLLSQAIEVCFALNFIMSIRLANWHKVGGFGKLARHDYSRTFKER
jgi:hypothetical protein